MTDLTKQAEEARRRARERMVMPSATAVEGIKSHDAWLDRLIALERAEAGLHWVEHLKDHNEGMCAACYLEGELEAAIAAIKEAP